MEKFIEGFAATGVLLTYVFCAALAIVVLLVTITNLLSSDMGITTRQRLALLALLILEFCIFGGVVNYLQG